MQKHVPMRPQIPVTAVSFHVTGQASSLLLAGQGSKVFIYNLDDGQLLASRSIFHDQPIHGIYCRTTASRLLPTPYEHAATCLFWGGRSISMLSFRYEAVSGEVKSLYLSAIAEHTVDDWILDACLMLDLGHADRENTPSGALLVTAHNQVLCCELGLPLSRSTKSSQFRTLSVGPASILYSAHITCFDSGTYLVAAGTVFGDVLFWMFDIGKSLHHETDARPSILLRKFSGHEGSVVGVRLGAVSAKGLLLASCSDDRTIRLWDTRRILDLRSKEVLFLNPDLKLRTGLGSDKEPSLGLASGCLGISMGHLSRIWSVRFVDDVSGLQLLSFGEDATVHVWKAKMEPPKRSVSPTHTMEAVHLELQDILGFHHGKNLWAGESLRLGNGKSHFVAGGADGGITAGNIDRTSVEMTWSGQFPTGLSESVLRKQEALMEAVFNSMIGKWKMDRTIVSKSPTFPSGHFDGTATLKSRFPTAAEYDCEMLYSEEGDFTADNGMVFQAKRKYVYRYRPQDGQITAWFVKPQEDEAVDYLFHKVEAQSNQGAISKSCQVTAKGHHLCVQDDYNAKYTFDFDRDLLLSWKLTYVVKGPNKDYVSSTSYSRFTEPNASTTELADATTDNPLAVGGQFANDEHFKAYCWPLQWNLLAISSKGQILIGSLHDWTKKSGPPPDFNIPVRWNTMGQLGDLRSYSICTKIGYGKILLGGTSGQIHLYDQLRNQITSVLKLDRKVAGIFMAGHERSNSDVHVVATCVGSPRASHFSISSTSLPIKSMASLELPPNFIVTSSGYLNQGFMILGSRAGALCLYRLSRVASLDVIEPACFEPHVHGHDAVTSICEVPTTTVSPEGVHFLTTGRDGTFAMHMLTPDLRFRTVHRSRPPFGPCIEGACFQRRWVDWNPQPETTGPQLSSGFSEHDLLLWGFRGKHFVASNHHEHKEILAADCGGAHRSWAFLPGGLSGALGCLVWTQAGKCHIHVQTDASHRIIQRGGHGRDIKALAVRPKVNGDMLPSLIATGAEDTTIRISKIVPSDREPRSLGTVSVISEHTTGVHALRWSRDGKFLFSSGGREELRTWRVQQVPCLEIGITCNARAPRVTASGELRITKFDVLELDGEVESRSSKLIVAGYSDSSLRVRAISHCFPFCRLIDSIALVFQTLFRHWRSCLARRVDLRHRMSHSMPVFHCRGVNAPGECQY